MTLLLPLFSSFVSCILHWIWLFVNPQIRCQLGVNPNNCNKIFDPYEGRNSSCTFAFSFPRRQVLEYACCSSSVLDRAPLCSSEEIRGLSGLAWARDGLAVGRVGRFPERPVKGPRHNATKNYIIIHGRGPVCVSQSPAVSQAQSQIWCGLSDLCWQGPAEIRRDHTQKCVMLVESLLKGHSDSRVIVEGHGGSRWHPAWCYILYAHWRLWGKCVYMCVCVCVSGSVWVCVCVCVCAVGTPLMSPCSWD